MSIAVSTASRTRSAGEPASAEARASRTARARAQAEHLKTRADQTVKQIEAKRPSSRTVQEPSGLRVTTTSVA